MKKFLVLVVVCIFCASIFNGCATAVSPVTGSIYMNVKGPMSPGAHHASSKVGKAQCTSILGIVATGDASIETAAKNGGITKIHHVDHHSTGILGIYAKFTTIVYGE